MTEFEILQIAARAIGIHLLFVEALGYGYWVGNAFQLWNSLQNSQDALQLLVELRLQIHWIDSNTFRITDMIYNVQTGDKLAILRQAITDSAVAIGQGFFR